MKWNGVILILGSPPLMVINVVYRTYSEI